MKAKSNVASKMQSANLANRITAKGNQIIASRIAKGLPIPTNIKNALVNTASAGKSLPSVIKRGLELAKQKKGVVPIALPKKTNLTAQAPKGGLMRAIQVAKQKAVMPQPQAPKGGLIRAMQMAKQRAVMPQAPQQRALPVSNLTKITNRMQVNRATPIQKSFMPVDLPYQNFAPQTKPIKITATNYSLPTNIDLVEPAVDAGIVNYYGK